MNKGIPEGMADYVRIPLRKTVSQQSSTIWHEPPVQRRAYPDNAQLLGSHAIEAARCAGGGSIAKMPGEETERIRSQASPLNEIG